MTRERVESAKMLKTTGMLTLCRERQKNIKVKVGP
jgi:hypothetical protein